MFKMICATKLKWNLCKTILFVMHANSFPTEINSIKKKERKKKQSMLQINNNTIMMPAEKKNCIVVSCTKKKQIPKTNEPIHLECAMLFCISMDYFGRQIPSTVIAHHEISGKTVQMALDNHLHSFKIRIECCAFAFVL